MSELDKFRNFKPAGPIAAAYLSDRQSKVKTIRGPVGSGKTVSSILDGLMAASAQMPVCRDGKIHFRDAVIGATYGQLERNLYPSWKYWLPECPEWTSGDWEGGGGRFATHTINFDVLRNGKIVEVCYEALFAALGELTLEQFMRGFEPSAWYLFEVDQLPEGVIEAAVGRLGRYPNADMLPPGVEWNGYVRADLNAPDIDSWYYKLAEEVKPNGFQAYVQPSGLSPKAENLQNLPKGYYPNLAEVNKHKKKWVRRFVANQYGPTDDGEPVYPEYSDDVHMAAERIKYDPSRGVYLGFDQGLTQPAGLALQRAASGQWRVLFELVPGRMNAGRFAELFKMLLLDRCPNCEISGAFADPAGFSGADKEAGELAWAETVSDILQVAVLPAPSQEIDLRLTAVRDELTFMIAPDVPGLILSPGDTPILRKGFASDYCYRRERVGNTDRFANIPDKSRVSSNPHDALQYALLGIKGRYGVIGGRNGSRNAPAASASTVVKSSFLGDWP
jgi:hypothetical protein